MPANSTFAIDRLIPDTLRLILGLIACLAPYQSGAQNICWPTFGPDQGLLHLDGFTDTLPDFVDPIDDRQFRSEAGTHKRTFAVRPKHGHTRTVCHFDALYFFHFLGINY